MPINRKILREIDKDLERHVPEPPDWKDVASNFKVRERHAVGHLDGSVSVVSTRENGDHEIRNYNRDGRYLNNEQIGRDKSHAEVVREAGARDGGKATVEKMDTD